MGFVPRSKKQPGSPNKPVADTSEQMDTFQKAPTFHGHSLDYDVTDEREMSGSEMRRRLAAHEAAYRAAVETSHESPDKPSINEFGRARESRKDVTGTLGGQPVTRRTSVKKGTGPNGGNRADV